MALNMSEDEIDDLLYFARTGELEDFNDTIHSMCSRESTTLSAVLLSAKDPHSGNGPLHMAAANGHKDLLKSVITALSQPTPQNATQLSILNAQNAAGNTPLHWAALNGHLESVKALIDAGADPTVTNGAGHDAVYEAELNDRREVVEWVLKEGEGLENGIGGGAEGEREEEDQEAGDGSGNVNGGGTEDFMEEEKGKSHEDALTASLRQIGLEGERKKSWS